MQARRILLLVFLLGSALNVGFILSAQDTAPLAPAAVSGKIAYAPFPVAITLDGEFDDWSGVPWTTVSKFMGSVHVKFAAAADADNLYLAADVTDGTIIAGQHGSDYWNEDSVEFYLNATGDLTLTRYEDGVVQLTIPAANIGLTGTDVIIAGVNADTLDYRSVTVANDHGYSVEIAVPLVNEVWTIEPAHEGVLGFNVHLNSAKTADRDTKLIWSSADASDTSYQNPSVFGQLVFFEIGEELTVPEPTPTNEPSTPLDPSITWESRAWDLVWADEFDGEAGTPVNADNWTAEIGGQGWGNNEREYYTARPENASMDGNGNLAIVARKENPGDYNCHYGVCEYTSARLISRGKVDLTYGRVEARIKVPYGQGIWPAFWMLGGGSGWPNGGEIDIMEYIGKEPRTAYGTVHGPGYSGAGGIGGSLSFDADVSDDFHVFAIDWDPDAIRWYIDGVMYFALTPDDLGSRRWVFDHDFFMILNLAVGGNWPGYPDETTVFPQTLLVDYVRVYKLSEIQP